MGLSIAAILSVAAVTAIVAIAIAAVTVTAIAVTPVAIAAVLAIAAVAVVIAVLAARHVNTIEHHAGVGKFVILSQSVDETEGRPWGIVSTADDYRHIGMTGNLQGVGHQSYRSSIEDYVVIVLAQQGDDLPKRLTGKHFGGVGRNRACQQQMEVLIDTGRKNLRLQVVYRHLVTGEQRGDALLTVGHIEKPSQGWLTDVETAEDYLLA